MACGGPLHSPGASPHVDMVGMSPRRSAEALAEGRCGKWFSQIPKGGERLLRFALKRGLVVGMVFLAAVQNLDDPLNLVLAADDRVHLTLLGNLGQIASERLESRRLIGVLLALAPFFGLLARGLARIVGELLLTLLEIRIQFLENLLSALLDIDVEVL